MHISAGYTTRTRLSGTDTIRTEGKISTFVQYCSGYGVFPAWMLLYLLQSFVSICDEYPIAHPPYPPRIYFFRLTERGSLLSHGMLVAGALCVTRCVKKLAGHPAEQIARVCGQTPAKFLYKSFETLKCCDSI